MQIALETIIEISGETLSVVHYLEFLSLAVQFEPFVFENKVFCVY